MESLVKIFIIHQKYHLAAVSYTYHETSGAGEVFLNPQTMQTHLYIELINGAQAFLQIETDVINDLVNENTEDIITFLILLLFL